MLIGLHVPAIHPLIQCELLHKGAQINPGLARHKINGLHVYLINSQPTNITLFKVQNKKPDYIFFQMNKII